MLTLWACLCFGALNVDDLHKPVSHTPFEHGLMDLWPHSRQCLWFMSGRLVPSVSPGCKYEWQRQYKIYVTEILPAAWVYYVSQQQAHASHRIHCTCTVKPGTLKAADICTSHAQECRLSQTEILQLLAWPHRQYEHKIRRVQISLKKHVWQSLDDCSVPSDQKVKVLRSTGSWEPWLAVYKLW